MGSVSSAFILPYYDSQNQLIKFSSSIDTRNSRACAAPPGQGSWEEIVQPWKVLPYARYVLKYYYGAGRLSAAEMMVAMAMRQAAFIPGGAAGGCTTRQIHLNGVGRWAGMSKARVLAVLKKKSPGLQRFFRQMQKHGAENGLLTFAVRNRIPLAPQHILALKAWVGEHAAAWRQSRSKRPLAGLIEQLREAIPNADALEQAWANLAAGQENWPQEDSLLDILNGHFGPLSPEDEAQALAYETALIQPGCNTVFTHYFADHWMKEFSSQESISILMLRNAGRGAHDASVKVAVFQSLSELAAYLRMDRRTAKKMLDDIAAGRGALSSFIWLAEPLLPGGSILLAVAMRDPLHPQHRQAAQDEGEQTEYAFGAKDVHRDAGAPREERQTVSSWHAKKIHFKRKPHLRQAQSASTLIKDSCELNSVQSQTENPQQLLESKQNNAEVVVPAAQWDLKRIITQQNLTPTLSTPLLTKTGSDQALILQAIGWLIYAYEHHAEDGRGIAAPLIFTAKRFTDTLHADYLDLARLGPHVLQGAAKSNYAAIWRQIGARGAKILQKALDRGLRGLLHELLPQELDGEADPETFLPEEGDSLQAECAPAGEIEGVAAAAALPEPHARRAAPALPEPHARRAAPADPFALGAEVLAALPAQEERTSPANPLEELLDCVGFAEGLEIAEEELRGCINALLALKSQQPHVFYPIFSESTLAGLARTTNGYAINVRLDPSRLSVFTASQVFPKAKAAAEYVFATMLRVAEVVLVCE